MAKKRVYNFDSFSEKVEEGYENPGFIVNEFEEENDNDIDSLGKGEDLAEEETPIEEAPIEEPIIEDEPVTPAENLDYGNGENTSDDEIKIMFNFIQDQMKSYANLIKNVDTVKLDKTTKEKIKTMYRGMQGV